MQLGGIVSGPSGVPRATAEYLAEFRTDVEGFVALEVVESCVGDHREMLPAAGVTYRAFVDPSGGSNNAMTVDPSPDGIGWPLRAGARGRTNE